MKNNGTFTEKLNNYLKKDIEGFVEDIRREFGDDCPFTIYGLNISVYLSKGKQENEEEYYNIYSIDCSQDLNYYSSIWEKYLKDNEKKFSKFEFDEHENRGWYENITKFDPHKKEEENNKDFQYSEIAKEERQNTDDYFKNVDEGWIEFIDKLDEPEKKFNISWVSSYIHSSQKSQNLEYPKWYVSSYLLIDIGNKINDEKLYKKAIRPAINKMLFNVSLSFHELLIEEKQLSIGLQATRAAISQVMARNMSHNIGSHVMNVLVNEEYLEKFNPKSLKSYKTKLPEDLEDKDCKPNRQIAIYNNYVKSRMDYLADITFGTPVMLSNKKAYSDIFCELDKVRLLLENISGRGEKFRYSITFKHNGNELSSDNDILLAIPNDVLGCQGIYNIIENVIRNSSKHGNSSTDVEHCEFTINIRDIKKEEIDKTNENLKFEANSLYCVEIYDNIAIKDNSLIKKQNDILNNKILNDYNQLRSESLGMIEMDASAAYLRQLDIISINSDDYDVKTDEEIHNDTNFNILKAFNASTDESKTILGYRFFVKKPQEALIVTDTSDGLKNLDDFAKNGITIVSCEDFKKQLDRDNTFNHEFMVLEQGKGIEELIKCKTGSLPLREYRKDKNCIKNLLELKSEVISKSLWEWREEELKNDYSSEKVKLEFDGKPKLSDHSRFDSSFLDHLEQIKQCQNNGDISKAWESITSCSFHYEALSSKGQYVLPTIYDEHNKVIPFKESEYFEGLGKIENYIPRIKVAESMLSRIIVIDERIQDKLKDEEYRIPYSEHYKMSNIYVPEKSLLDLKDKKIVISKIDNFIAKITEDEKGNIPFKFNPNYDFLLVHYSILERAYGCLSEDDKKDDKGKILDRKEWINEWFKKHKDNATIVVTSGRGNIEDLPSYVRYVNLSSVTTALKEIKSKYLIHQILYSSRKTKKK